MLAHSIILTAAPASACCHVMMLSMQQRLCSLPHAHARWLCHCLLIVPRQMVLRWMALKLVLCQVVLYQVMPVLVPVCLPLPY